MKTVYALGKSLSVLISVGAVLTTLFLWLATDPGTQPSLPPFLAVLAALFGSSAAAVVVHELGHVLACLAVGAQVRGFRIGSGRQPRIRFRVRKVAVTIGWPGQGLVTYEGARSLWRRAIITVAGAVTNLAIVGLVLLALQLPAHVSNTYVCIMDVIALGFAVVGLNSLTPHRGRDGRLSDGATMLRLRSSIRAGELQDLRVAMTRAAGSGRVARALEMHAGLEFPAERVSDQQAAELVVIEWLIAGMWCPDGLPAEAASLAERRVDFLLRSGALGPAQPLAHLTLAVHRLRQQRFAEAEQLAATARDATGAQHKAWPKLALATAIVAREARGLPCDDLLSAANPALWQDALEAAGDLKWATDTNAMMRAFRDGDLVAHLRAGNVAPSLLRAGRVADLLDLHAGVGLPAGPHADMLMYSMHNIECHLLYLPGLPAQVIEEAAGRVQWILDNFSFDAKSRGEASVLNLPRAAVLHTLAVARLREGKFDEVEPLCAPGLAADHGPDARATLLATVALAHCALGRPHEDLLAEAVALAPDADLVPEAVAASAAARSEWARDPGSPGSPALTA